MDRVGRMSGMGGEKFPEGRKKRKNFLHISPFAPLPLLCFWAMGAGETLIAAFPAAVLHELGHVAAIYLTGGRVVHVDIEPFGGEIRTDGRLCSYTDSLFVSLSGIFVNFFCALPLLFPGVPPVLFRFALCSLGMGLFNLLPLKGLDGGDALEFLLLQRVSMEKSEKICRIVAVFGVLLLIIVILAGIFFSFFNPMLLLLTGYLVLRLI